MLSSLKKWVQDVAVDLAPPLSSSSSNSISDTTNHYFYSSTPINESRKSSSSAVYLSQPISLESLRSSRANIQPILPTIQSPVELDLSHLNREEQEHIANVLKRARAVEEQQQPPPPQSILPALRLSPAGSFSSSTSSLNDEQKERSSNEMLDQTEKLFPLSESSNQQCQLEKHDNDFVESEIETINNHILPSQHSLSINKNQCEIIPNIELVSKQNSSTQQLLTEIDDNDFLYDEPSPYENVLQTSAHNESIASTYQIDECPDDDDVDERDHVKELEETIANLSRHFPSDPIHETTINSETILEMEIESPINDESSPPSLSAKTSIESTSLSYSIPINSLSRSSGIRENLTDLILDRSSNNKRLQRTLSTNTQRVSSINRHKRNLPSVPNQLQIRRTNSESRFTLPAVPFSATENLDDESDLLEIDLNDPIGSMNRIWNHTYQDVQIQPQIKQSRDQTTNTSPTEDFSSQVKLRKKSKKKSNSSSTTHSSDEINHHHQQQQHSSTVVSKLQKSTSTEITYPFPVSKLILNPSRHGIAMDLGFRITGGHSSANCMEVTACIVDIDRRHRNYQILRNIVHEGDEVLELGGVSLRGKSALFVDELVNKIQNEFEIIVRDRTSFNPIDDNNNNLEQTEHISDPEPLPSSQTLTKKDTNIEQQISNDSDETDSLSQYFHSSSHSRTSSIMAAGDSSISHGRSQSVIPLQNILKSDSKRMARNSTALERKSSLSFASLKFLKKKTKSVDLSPQQVLLMNYFRENNYAGEIEIQIKHDNDNEQLHVRIIQAKNLLPKDTNGYSDPFVKINLLPGRDQENKRRIKHMTKTLNPQWDQTVTYGHIHREELQHKKLEITVWDYDRFKANDFLGQVTIDLKNPNVIDDKHHWYRLQSLRAREEITNRGSSPRLSQMHTVESSSSGSLTTKKNTVQFSPKNNQSR